MRSKDDGVTKSPGRPPRYVLQLQAPLCGSEAAIRNNRVKIMRQTLERMQGRSLEAEVNVRLRVVVHRVEGSVCALARLRHLRLGHSLSIPSQPYRPLQMNAHQ